MLDQARHRRRRLDHPRPRPGQAGTYEAHPRNHLQAQMQTQIQAQIQAQMLAQIQARTLALKRRTTVK